MWKYRNNTNKLKFSIPRSLASSYLNKNKLENRVEQFLCEILIDHNIRERFN